MRVIGDGLLVRNTAVPGTLIVRDCGTRARKGASGRLSCLQRASIRSRPRSQVVMRATSVMPNTRGTHPPSMNFSVFAEKKVASIMKKEPNTKIVVNRDQWNSLLKTLAIPTSLLHNMKHNKVLHERVLFVTVQTEDEPEVSATHVLKSRNWRRVSTG